MTRVRTSWSGSRAARRPISALTALVVAALAALATLLATTGPAAATTTSPALDAAAQELRAGESVYVAPDARRS